MAITWRNVGQTVSAGDAAQLFRGANASIQGGLDKLTGALRSVETGREDQFNTEVERNTDTFLNRLSQYGSPEELQAAQESGAIERMRSAFGNRIDQDATRGAAESRLLTLRNQEIAGAQHELTTDELNQNRLRQGIRGVEEEINAFNESGDTAAARALADENRDALVAAGRWDEAIGSTRVARERGEDRTETLAARREAAANRNEAGIQRARNSAARTAGDFRSQAINVAPDDAAFARQHYLDSVAAYNANDKNTPIPQDVVNAELGRLEQEWNSRWNLTEGQKLDHLQESQMLDEAAERAIGHNRAALEQLRESHTNMLNFAWNDESRPSVGTVQQEMRFGIDGDPNRIITTDENEISFINEKIDEEIEAMYKPKIEREINRGREGTRTEVLENPLYQEGRDWGSEAKENKGAIMKEVARRLSGDNSWLTRLDGVDVRQSPTQMRETINEVLADFQESRRREEEIRNAENQSRIRESLILGQISGAKRHSLEQYKELNRAIGSTGSN